MAIFRRIYLAFTLGRSSKEFRQGKPRLLCSGFGSSKSFLLLPLLVALDSAVYVFAELLKFRKIELFNVYGAMIAVLMPTNRPSRVISAPPELPGLIDASVWMKSS